MSKRIHLRLDMRIPVPLRRYTHLPRIFMLRIPELLKLVLFGMFNFFKFSLCLLLQPPICYPHHLLFFMRDHGHFIVIHVVVVWGALWAQEIFSPNFYRVLLFGRGNFAPPSRHFLYIFSAASGRNFILFFCLWHLWWYNLVQIDDFYHQWDF